MDGLAPILVFSDRDGVINEDRDYYLGSAKAWREQVEFLPGVIEGIRLINDMPGAKFIIVSNQSGVALAGAEFDDFTEDRLGEVNEEIISRLKKEGAVVDASFYCPYVRSSYVEEARQKGRLVHPEYVRDDADCIKPRPGMIRRAAQHFGWEIESIEKKFMIGDLIKDIETGLNAGCISFFVESHTTRQKGEEKKIKNLVDNFPGKVFKAGNFLQAARMITEISSQ